MNKPKKILSTCIIAFAFILTSAVLFFLAGRYAWKIGGFGACDNARIENVTVGDSSVHITGSSATFVPQGFLGHVYKEESGALYVGVNFDSFFGMFELGRFDITVPTDEEITKGDYQNNGNHRLHTHIFQ